MNYCIPAQLKNFKHYDEVAEIIIEFNRGDSTLPAFIEKHSNQTIILNTWEYEEADFKLIASICKKYPNVKLRIPYNKDYINKVIEENIPFFFMTKATNWNIVNLLASYHPTDMYIINELGFSIAQIAEFLHTRGIKVRVFPSVAQASMPETPAYRKFFIRPEDIDFYSQYVDVCEFLEKERTNILYELYAIDKKWIGKISDFTFDFHEDYSNIGVVPGFGQIRSKCGKRCERGKDCDACKLLLDLSNSLTENHFQINS